mmetsp:Transcript_91960/g.295741  ORF Transcript_91960/g.295741 Transcript_91960/m.295741 type:complete len:273 (-) Transcript_91960:280-1098(-)
MVSQPDCDVLAESFQSDSENFGFGKNAAGAQPPVASIAEAVSDVLAEDYADAPCAEVRFEGSSVVSTPLPWPAQLACSISSKEEPNAEQPQIKKVISTSIGNEAITMPKSVDFSLLEAAAQPGRVKEVAANDLRGQWQPLQDGSPLPSPVSPTYAAPDSLRRLIPKHSLVSPTYVVPDSSRRVGAEADAAWSPMGIESRRAFSPEAASPSRGAAWDADGDDAPPEDGCMAVRSLGPSGGAVQADRRMSTGVGRPPVPPPPLVLRRVAAPLAC